MYQPPAFKEDRVPILHDAIRTIGFGTLVTCGTAGMEASHIPMLLDPEPSPFGTLQGHLARANPQWKGASGEAFAIFLGPNAYVSPSWYPSKAETGKVVPTWNYLAVHAYGDLSFFDDPAQLREQVRRLTDTHEQGRAVPWAISDAPEDFIATMLGAIVGFRLTIRRLEGKWKLSQNRSEADRVGVRDGLIREGGDTATAMAEMMAGQSERNGIPLLPHGSKGEAVTLTMVNALRDEE
jgi:transcriptional regulator